MAFALADQIFHTESFPAFVEPLTPTAPTATQENDVPTFARPAFNLYRRLTEEEPLYTEINIPLPPIPSAFPAQTPCAPSASTTFLTPPPPTYHRHHSRTLSCFSSFSRSRLSLSKSRKSNESSRASGEWPRIRKEIVKNREVAAAMDLSHQSKRSSRRGTLDALAVVPAVLMLSAELFTPGTEHETEGKRKDSGVGRWEEGIR